MDVRVAGKEGAKNEKATNDQGCLWVGFGISVIESICERKIVDKE
jgi:hypothetical protein